VFTARYEMNFYVCVSFWTANVETAAGVRVKQNSIYPDAVFRFGLALRVSLSTVLQN